MKISVKLVYQYMIIFFNFSPTSNHLHPLQIENCDSNSRLVVDEDDNGKFRPERGKCYNYPHFHWFEAAMNEWMGLEAISLHIIYRLNWAIEIMLWSWQSMNERGQRPCCFTCIGLWDHPENTSETLAQHSNNLGWPFGVCWVYLDDTIHHPLTNQLDIIYLTL